MHIEEEEGQIYLWGGMGNMARPKLDIDYPTFEKLYNLGYQDSAIARILGVDRSTITRRRQAINLPANRKVGERGPAVKENEPYWLAVRRSLKYVGDYISDAARAYYKETGDFERFFICFVMEPKPMYHGIPGAHAPEPSRMNYKSVQKIIEYEQNIEMTAMAGVPGPAILELASVYKSADEETCKKLAREAVETAGLINSTTLVSEVITLTPPQNFFQYWKEKLQEVLTWTPVKQWTAVKQIRKVSKEARQTANCIIQGRAGRRGKGGGLQSLRDHQAFQAALGY